MIVFKLNLNVMYFIYLIIFPVAWTVLIPSSYIFLALVSLVSFLLSVLALPVIFHLFA